MKKLFDIGLWFAGGLVCGLVLALALAALQGRNGGAPGGEILIPLMLVLLPYVGYSARQLLEPTPPQARQARCNPTAPPAPAHKSPYDWSVDV